MNKRIWAPMLALLMILSATAAHSANAADDPTTIVRETTDKVLDRVRADKEALEADTGRMYDLVSELIFPHFDFPIMSQFVLGEHWSEADEASRTGFIEQFRKLLVRTYATALLQFSNQEITYPPVEQSGRASFARVMQDIAQPGSSPLSVLYRLHNKSGEWKVYDVSISGVSLIQTYKANFDSKVKKDGLDGLIASLDSKNQQYGN